jgi:hypothetical protein
LAVEHHHSVAQMHEQVFITIELLVQGRKGRPLTESDAILPHPPHATEDEMSGF